jgi:cytochrome b561
VTIPEAPTPAASVRYDRATIVFHWLTALCVVVLFLTAFWWNALPGGTPLRKFLQALHVSVAIGFTVVFVGRMIWRFTKGRLLAAANKGAADWAARGVHIALYILLATQVALGFLLRWSQGEEFMFFGLFSVPETLGPDKAWAKVWEWWHNANGWAIIYLAGAHAVAALTHHYVLRDKVLKRMLPARG